MSDQLPGPAGAWDPGGAGPVARAWASSGHWRDLLGHRAFVVDLPPLGAEEEEPLLVVHGYPTSSLDFHLVADALRRTRRVVLLDLIGFGLSAKPDRHYTMDLQADVVAELTGQLQLTELALLTHDMGDTVGGELLARQMEGRWPVRVTRRVVTNGSIYIEWAQLTDGQLLLLGLPDEKLAEGLVTRATISASLRATFHPSSAVDQAELDGAWDVMSWRDGHLLLARTIRYIEERRRNQSRFTGAIERHPSPLGVVWGAYDPIAVVAMARRLAETVPSASLTILDGVGHYPMLEQPERFAEAVSAAL